MLQNSFALIFSALLIYQTTRADDATTRETSTKFITEINNVAFQTKEIASKAIEDKTKQLITALRKVRGSTPGKMTHCYNTLQRLARATSEELLTCVTNQSEEALKVIYGKNSGSLGATYGEKGKTDFCSEPDVECGVNEASVEEHIELIKNCAVQAIDKAGTFARRCVH